MKRRIELLREHPQQSQIYPVTDEAVKSLAENIQQLGQLEPAIITPDNILLSGYTRMEALKLLGRSTIDVKVMPVAEDQQLYFLISANKQRVKNYVCRVAEIEALEEYYSKGQGHRSDLDGSLDPPEGTSRRPPTIQLIASDLGMSKNTVHKLQYIKKHREDLLPHIGQDITLTSCYAQVSMWLNQKKVIAAKKRKRKEIQTGRGFTIYNKPAETMHEELEENSVDVIVTSPPYYQQRVFDDHTKELGQEKTIDEFVNNLLKVFEQCKRVLKPTGSLFLNMGDTYINSRKMQVPERLSLALGDKQGWILKNDLIWWKNTSAAPESTKRRWHTDFEHFYFFCLDTEAYLFDADSIRIPYATDEPVDRKAPRHYSDMVGGANPRWVNRGKAGVLNDPKDVLLSNVGSSLRHPAGKIPGCIIQSPNVKRQLKMADVEHTAAFPTRLIEQIMKPTVPAGGVVLDPFSGAGTTGLVALDMGASYVGYEINGEFATLSSRRLKAHVENKEKSSRSATKN